MQLNLQKPSPLAQKLKSNLKPNVNDTLIHCPETLTTLLQIARSAFTDDFLQLFKTTLVNYRAC